MNTTIVRPPITRTSLENEVLVSVILLYFVISSALLLIHHLQPEDAVTKTSSPSPSHAGFHVAAAPSTGPQAEPVGPVGPQHWLTQAGYADVRDLQWDGERWRATAEKNGQRWMLQIDPRPVIVATPVAAVPTR